MQQNQEQGCRQRSYEISAAQLPLCCPLPDQRVWDAHPRVYLPIESEGHVVCPYCETQYVLVENQ